jgi:selenide,water dikinase
MGGRVVMAVNVAGFPEHFPKFAIAEIFAAAAEVVAMAGGSIAGGHTIRNPEPIFGLAVQGVVHPQRIFRKGGARAGDVAMLSKPLGTGLALAGGSPTDIAESIAGMRMLNRLASEQLQALGAAVHGVTDVTGYGLVGHGWEMAERSGVQLIIEGEALPAYRGAREAAARGVRTSGDPRNRQYVEGHFLDSRPSPNHDDAITALCMDPQTSGGLMAAVSPEVVDELLSLSGVTWTRIGEFIAGDPCVVLH